MSDKIEKAKKALQSALAHAGVNRQGDRIINAVNNLIEAHKDYLRVEDVNAALAEKNAEISRLKARLRAAEFLAPLNNDHEEFLNKVLPLYEIIDALNENRIDIKTAEEMHRALNSSDQSETSTTAFR